MKNPGYPFCAIVGQQQLQFGLLLTTINPAIGGILIRGEKGTAKSTAVRALADLLREGDDGMPVVELPLNTTADMLAGSLDFQTAIRHGEVVLQPGLLARADGGILYVDEVNLLDDHLVDLLLDTAASGRNVVEREGLSGVHSARFLLVGTMNPEEGELRPQLLDRFGLCVELKGLESCEQRVELLLRREACDADPEGFCRRYAADQTALRQQLNAARRRLQRLRLSGQQRGFIAELAKGSNVAGHRADLILEQAALACAAFEGAEKVEIAHITRVAPFVMLHRMREAEVPPPPPADDRREQQSEPRESPAEEQNGAPQETHERSSQQQEQGQQQGQGQGRHEEPAEQSSPSSRPEESGSREYNSGGDEVFEIGTPHPVKAISSARDRRRRRGSGRRSRSRIEQKEGRYVRAALPGGGGVDGDLAFDATLRAAAPWQRQRRHAGSPLAVQLRPVDIRFRVREKRLGNLLIFVVDGSGSMGARGRMIASKGAIMSLLLDAYQKRDKVAMVSFRGRKAHVNLPVTGSVELAATLLAKMPVGGRTPLAAGLIKGYQLARNHLLRDSAARPIMIVITDGRSNVSVGDEEPLVELERLAAILGRDDTLHAVVVDTEETGPVSFGLARHLAAAMAADYFRTEELRAEELVRLVRDLQQ